MVFFPFLYATHTFGNIFWDDDLKVSLR
jgi:hypothetical protein